MSNNRFSIRRLQSYRHYRYVWVDDALRGRAYDTGALLKLALCHMDQLPIRELVLRAEVRAPLTERATRKIASQRRAAGVVRPQLVWAANPLEFRALIREAELSSYLEFPTPKWERPAPQVVPPRGFWAILKRLFQTYQGPPDQGRRIWAEPPWVPTPSGALVLAYPEQAQWHLGTPSMLQVKWAGMPTFVFAGGDLVPESALGHSGDLSALFAETWSRQHLDVAPGSPMSAERRREVEAAVLLVYRLMRWAEPEVHWQSTVDDYCAMVPKSPLPGPMVTPQQQLQALCKQSNLDGTRRWTPHQMQIGRNMYDAKMLSTAPSTLDAWQIAVWRWRTQADPLWRGMALPTPNGLSGEALDPEHAASLLGALERAACVPWAALEGRVLLLDPVAVTQARGRWHAL